MKIRKRCGRWLLAAAVCVGVSSAAMIAGAEKNALQTDDETESEAAQKQTEIPGDTEAAASGAVDYTRVAPAGEQLAPEPVAQYGMLPVYGCDVKDGVYAVEVRSGSKMFRVEEATLTVEHGEMTAEVTLSGQGYSKLYAGTAAEAAAAEESEYIGYTEGEDGRYTYEIPVEALDAPLDLAAFSKRKEQWYDRQVLFDAGTLPEDALLLELPDYDLIEAAVAAYREDGTNGSEQTTDETPQGETEQFLGEVQQSEAEQSAGELHQEKTELSSDKEPQSKAELSADETPQSEAEQPPGGALQGETEQSSEESHLTAEASSVDLADGEYAIDVSLTGGSGKASVSSPTLLVVRGGRAYAQLQWSSSNYDYMVVGGEKYLNTNTEGGNSVFEIPVEAFDRSISVIADTTAMGTPHEVAYTLMFYADTIGPKSQLPQEAAKRVVYIALVIIVGGGILNHIVKKRRAL